MDSSIRTYTETTKDGKFFLSLDAYKAITGHEFAGQKIPVYCADDSDDKYRVAETTDDNHHVAEPAEDSNTFLNMDAYQSNTDPGFTGHIIPVYTSDDKFDVAETPADGGEASMNTDKSITGRGSTGLKISVHTNDNNNHVTNRTADKVEIDALREELDFLKKIQATQETIHQTEIVSLKVSLASALSKINVLEHEVSAIASLKATIDAFDQENRILRWHHNRMLATIEGNEGAAAEEEKKMPKKEETRVQVQGGVKVLHVGLIIILLVLVMAFAASRSGYTHRDAVAALEDGVAAVGRVVERVVDAVDGSWGTIGCQAVNGRQL